MSGIRLRRTANQEQSNSWLYLNSFQFQLKIATPTWVLQPPGAFALRTSISSGAKANPEPKSQGAASVIIVIIMILHTGLNSNIMTLWNHQSRMNLSTQDMIRIIIYEYRVKHFYSTKIVSHNISQNSIQYNDIMISLLRANKSLSKQSILWYGLKKPKSILQHDLISPKSLL